MQDFNVALSGENDIFDGGHVLYLNPDLIRDEEDQNYRLGNIAFAKLSLTDLWDLHYWVKYRMKECGYWDERKSELDFEEQMMDLTLNLGQEIQEKIKKEQEEN